MKTRFTVLLCVVILTLLFWGGSMWMRHAQNKQESKASVLAVLYTDINLDGKKDIISIYGRHKSKYLIEATTQKKKLLWATSCRAVGHSIKPSYPHQPSVFHSENILLTVGYLYTSTTQKMRVLITAVHKKNGSTAWSWTSPLSNQLSLFTGLSIHQDSAYLILRHSTKKHRRSHTLYRFQLKTGKLLWSRSIHKMSFPRSPKFTGKDILFSDPGRLHVFSKKTGTYRFFPLSGNLLWYKKKHIYFVAKQGKYVLYTWDVQKRSSIPYLVKGKSVALSMDFSPYEENVEVVTGGLIVHKGSFIKTKNSFLDLSSGQWNGSISLDKGFGVYRGYNSWKRYRVGQQPSTVYVPWIAHRYTSKKGLFDTRLYVIDRTARKVVWKSRIVRMKINEIARQALFQQGTHFFLTLPYKTKNGSGFKKSLWALDGMKGSFSGGFRTQWHWGDQKWFGQTLEVSPWQVQGSLLIGKISTFLLFVDLKTEKVHYKNSPNVRIQKKQQETIDTWGNVLHIRE